MKILLLGDYSNYHACLGAALAREGHQVTVASDGGGWMHTATTLPLRRPFPGPAGGALLFARMSFDRRLRGYDVVSLISPSFVRLKPWRLRVVYDMLEKHNGRVFLGAVGTDKAVMDYLTSPNCKLRYNEYFNGGNLIEANSAQLRSDLEWTRGEIGEWCNEVYERCHGITSALYEYQLAMENAGFGAKLKYTGIPIDLDTIQPLGRELCSRGKIEIFLGRHAHRMTFKGTDRLEAAAKRVADEFPYRCSLEIVENLPYNEYLKSLHRADLVLDQLYSYTPATNALLAMAAGQAVVSGGEQEFYEFIGEKSLRPIINVIPDDEHIYNTLRQCILNPERVRKAGSEGREFVAKHNNASLVARRHIEFWES